MESPLFAYNKNMQKITTIGGSAVSIYLKIKHYFFLWEGK
jgi:hypothetical protein